MGDMTRSQAQPKVSKTRIVLALAWLAFSIWIYTAFWTFPVGTWFVRGLGLLIILGGLAGIVNGGTVDAKKPRAPGPGS